MAKLVEFYFDFGSPNTYLAHTQMSGIAERTGAGIVYRPILLGGVFKATDNVSPALHPLKEAYMQADLPRCAKRWGVPFAINPHFPINTHQLMRGAVVLRDEDIFPAYADTVFRALWAEEKDMGDPAVVAKVLGGIGIDAEDFVARISEAGTKQALIAATEAAVGRGIFGAPTMFVGDEMFFGQDRLDYVEAALG